MEDITQRKKQKFIPAQLFVQGGIFLMLATLVGLYIYDLFYKDLGQGHHQLQHKQSSGAPSGTESKDWATLFMDLGLKLETTHYDTKRGDDLTNVTNQFKNINSSVLDIKTATANASQKSDINTLFTNIDTSINTSRQNIETAIGQIDLAGVNTHTTNSLTPIENRLIDVQGNLTDVETQVALLTTQQNLADAKSDIITEIDTKYNATKQLVDNVQNTTGSIKTQLDGADGVQAQIETDIANVQTSVGNVYTAVGIIHDNVSTIKTNTDNIITELGTMSSTLTTIDTITENTYQDTQNLITNVGNVNTAVGNIGTALSNTSGKVDNLVTSVGNVSGLVNDVKTAVDAVLLSSDYSSNVTAQNQVILGYINQVLGNISSINTTDNNLLNAIKTKVDSITISDYASRFDTLDSSFANTDGKIDTVDTDVKFITTQNIFQMSGIALSKLDYTYYQGIQSGMVTFDQSNMIFEYDESNQVVALKIWSSGENITKLNLCKSGSCQNVRYMEVNQQTDLSGLCSGSKACHSLEFVKFNYDVIPQDFCNGSNVKLHFMDDDACQSLQVVDLGAAATINAGFCSNGCNSMQQLIASNVLTILDMCADEGCNNLMHIDLLQVTSIASMGVIPNLQSIRVDTVDNSNQEINGDTVLFTFITQWAANNNKMIDIIASDGVYGLSATGITSPPGM